MKLGNATILHKGVLSWAERMQVLLFKCSLELDALPTSATPWCLPSASGVVPALTNQYTCGACTD